MAGWRRGQWQPLRWIDYTAKWNFPEAKHQLKISIIF
jgi:hypothetical protein